MKETPWADTVMQAHHAPAKPVLMVVDDEPGTLFNMQCAFEKLGYDVRPVRAEYDFDSMEELSDLLAHHKPDFVLSDMQMNLAPSGTDVLAASHAYDPQLPVIIHTGAINALPPESTMEGVAAILEKPTGSASLRLHCQRVDSIFQTAQMKRLGLDTPVPNGGLQL